MRRLEMRSALALCLAVASSSAAAIHLSTDGRGQVLIYPYYTVNGGNTTLISVVNTTEEAKAVKVSFREAMNGQAVLDFNLYLGPLDVWTGAITAEPEGLDPAHAPAAVLQTSDSACTVPQIPAVGIPFVNFMYAFYDEDDSGPYENSRTRAGYVEVIEMGRLIGEFAAAATRTEAGVPANCQRLVNASMYPQGIWVNQPDHGLLPPAGGLYGGAQIVDVGDGTNLSYSADAIDGFYTLPTGSLNRVPPEYRPDLGSVFMPVGALDLGSARMSEDGTVSAYVFDDGELIRLDFDESMSAAPGLKAMSAVLMREWIYNEFDVTPGFATEWVVTFPTRRLHLDYPEMSGGGFFDREPFRAAYDYNRVEGDHPTGNGEQFRYEVTNRETIPSIELVFSAEPGTGPMPLGLSSNVLQLGGARHYTRTDVWHGAEPTPVLCSYTGHNIKSDFYPCAGPYCDAGTGRLLFDKSHHKIQDRNGHIIRGLPVLGFSAIKVTQEGGSGSALANFSVTHRHHMQTTVDTADGN